MPATPRSHVSGLVLALVAQAAGCSYSEERFHRPGCLGSYLLEGVCLSGTPTGDITLTTSIDTATRGAGGCTEILPQPGGPSLCVVAATSIRISGGARIRATAQPAGATATGTNPLVLVATDSIVIDGTLDVASRTGELAVGGGARTAVGCGSSTDVDGRPGKPNGSVSGIGGGGGAGGGFGNAGGSGGTGGNGTSTVAAGNPHTPELAGVVVGGCPGGKGGNGNASDGTTGRGGVGGAGGGAVYLLASGSITIAGTINASGSGGGAGEVGSASASEGSSGGGGGGGAGGLIGLEAPSISVTGSLFANGGGGGGGFGGLLTNGMTRPGADPSAANIAAAGGTSNNGGGAGGNGGACAMNVGPGGPGRNAPGDVTPESGGGGGGGGVGVLHVFGDPQPALPVNAISPCA